MRLPFTSKRPSTTASGVSNVQTSGGRDTGLPPRPKDDPPPEYEDYSTESRLQIHPIPSRDAALVKIEPPREPAQPIKHVPCDIVLVIDVSYSMSDAAPVPGEKEEDNGLSILDLVKHATNTIIQTCNEDDRIGIVKFSNAGEAVQPLTKMTPENKKMALQRVEWLRPESATNLWGGIHCGLSLFNDASQNVPAIMVLTDGMPNHMCPPQGYVPKLTTMVPLPATIHTFGFGYQLDSGLLKSIAEFGGGNYGFIPDAGMIGTVFNHAVANLQSTFATEAVLKLVYPQNMTIEEGTGPRVDVGAPKEQGGGLVEVTLPLGNLQFGQSRDIYLRTSKVQDSKLTAVSATLEYKRAHTLPSNSQPPRVTLETSADLTQPGHLSDAEIAFHDSRAQLCAFILTLFRLRKDSTWVPAGGDLHAQRLQELESLIQSIPARDFVDTDENNSALMEDICGEQPSGQIQIAIGNESYLDRWGRHYLLSYMNAHARQICNSFKDQGPQRYGIDSPLFKRCLSYLDEQFDKLPPPKPSREPIMHGANGQSYRSGSSHISISRYNNSSAPCFAGSTSVELASGRQVCIKRLRRGMRLRTPLGPRKVAFVLKTPVSQGTLCRIGRLLVTPWHPISLDGGKTWDFPVNLAHGAVRYTGAVYSVMLQRDARSASHAIRVEDAWGVTLGHGMTSACRDDIRGHEFWADWNRLSKELVRLGASRRGVVVGAGVQRDDSTGLVTALK